MGDQASGGGVVREIRDENGDLLFRVYEENPGTVFRALRCDSRSEQRRALQYPENWHRLSDIKLYKLCGAAELIPPPADAP